jgi:Insertion element 4 transposase N-terminal/Transposase DDE domain
VSDTAMPKPSRARPGPGGERGSGPVAVTAQVTTTSTVAAGVFAAGHLGELTQQVPFELVDAVLELTRATQHRLRELPSRVGVYFVLALGLFPGLGYRRVWGKLVAGLRGLGVRCPSDKALRDLRRRLGPAPVKALFEVLAGPVAGPHTPGVRFGRYRTVAFDGCTSIKVADSERNQAWLGKLRAARGVTGYPTVELMTLVETGTRALLGAVFGPPAVGETDYARRLLKLLGPDMLVLADRGFDAAEFLAELAATGAGYLVRLRGNRRLPVLARCDDGSFLSRLGSHSVGSSAPTSPSPAPTAPGMPLPTGSPPPSTITAATPRER